MSIKLGLLKWVHSRWALLPLLARFHHSSKVADLNAFLTKIEQAREMILQIHEFRNLADQKHSEF